MKRTLLNAGLAALVSTALLGAPAVANAEPLSQASDSIAASESTNQDQENASSEKTVSVGELREALKSSDATEGSVTTPNGDKGTAYTLPSGSKIIISNETPSAQPYVSGGTLGNGKGVWLEFNQTDQKAIKAGGAAAAVGIIGLINPIAGAAAGAIAAAVSSYIGDKGICSSNKKLRIEGDWNGALTSTKCV